MGDEILKTLLKTFFFVLVYTSFIDAKDNLSLGNEVKEYDRIFEKIAEKRIGIEVLKIEKLDNPFIVTGSGNESESNESSVQPVYFLEATFDQKAKINGSWYTIKDQINTWKLVKINRNSVILQNEIEKKEIFIRTKDESNIKIFSK